MMCLLAWGSRINERFVGDPKSGPLGGSGVPAGCRARRDARLCFCPSGDRGSASTDRSGKTCAEGPALAAGEEHVDGVGRFLESFHDRLAVLELTEHFPLTQLRCRFHEARGVIED